MDFTYIPQNLRTPGVFIEFDSSKSGNFSEKAKILVFGSSTHLQEKSLLINNLIDAKDKYSDTSVLYKQLKLVFNNQNSLSVFAYATKSSSTSTTIDKILEEIKTGDYRYIILNDNNPAFLIKVANVLDSLARPPIQKPARAFVGFSSTVDLTTKFGNSLNSEHIIALASLDATVNAAIFASSFGAKVAGILVSNPNKPLTNLIVSGAITSSNPAQSVRDMLLFNGISTFIKTSDNRVAIERIITTYKKTSSGLETDVYLDVQTIETLDAIRREQISFIFNSYINSGYKLASSLNANIKGSKIVTTALLRASLLNLYQEKLQFLGWVSNYEKYKKSLFVEIDKKDKTRINFVDSPLLVRPLRIVAGRIAFV